MSARPWLAPSWLRLASVAPICAALLAGTAVADFTEYEDQPFLLPGNPETNDLTSPLQVPWDGAPFLTAYPTGIKLIRGNLDASDIDSYQISVSLDDVVIAALFDDEGGARLDSVLGLFSGGALPALALDDDGGEGLLARLALTTTSSGAIEIGVSGVDDTAFDGSHHEARAGLLPYRLVIGVANDPPALEESDASPGPQGSNDSLASADALPANGGLLGARLEVADVDYFAIDLEAGDRLMVFVQALRAGTFEPAAGGLGDPVIGLFDPTGAPVASGLDDDGHTGFAPGLSFTVPALGDGTWKLAVSGFGDTAFNGSHGEDPFDYLLLVARERACPNVAMLITGLSASTGNPYAVAALKGGDHYHSDRINPQQHVVVDVPEPLECGEWIKTANNDKTISADPHLQFTLAQDGSVYVGFDSRATGEPPWLASGFTPTSDVIDVFDPSPTQEYEVFRRDFAAGPVQLGGNQPSGAGSNYVVLAKPLDTTDTAHAFVIPEPIPSGLATMTVAGVTISVPTTAGQSAASVAIALASALNADPTLQTARIFALASGDAVVTTGTIQDAAVIHAAVSLAGPLAWTMIACLMTAIAVAQLRGDRRTR